MPNTTTRESEDIGTAMMEKGTQKNGETNGEIRMMVKGQYKLTRQIHYVSGFRTLDYDLRGGSYLTNRLGSD